MDELVLDNVLSYLNFAGLYHFSQTCKSIYEAVRNSIYYTSYESRMIKFKYGYYSTVTFYNASVIGNLNTIDEKAEIYGRSANCHYIPDLYYIHAYRGIFPRNANMWPIVDSNYKIVSHENDHRIIGTFIDGDLLLIRPFTDPFGVLSAAPLVTLKETLTSLLPRRSYITNKILRIINANDIFGVNIFAGICKICENEDDFINSMMRLQGKKYYATRDCSGDIYEILRHPKLWEMVVSYLESNDMALLLRFDFLMNNRSYRKKKTK